MCTYCSLSLEHSHRRYYLHGLLRPFLPVWLTPLIIRGAFLPRLFKQQPPPSFLAPDPFFFSMAPVTVLHVSVYSLPPSARADAVVFRGVCSFAQQTCFECPLCAGPSGCVRDTSHGVFLGGACHEATEQKKSLGVRR